MSNSAPSNDNELQQLKSDLSSLRSRFSGLESRLSLGDIHQEVVSLGKSLLHLQSQLSDLRNQRNYQFEGLLEDRLTTLLIECEQVDPIVQRAIATEASRLLSEGDRLRGMLNHANYLGNNLGDLRTQVGLLRREISGLEEMVNGASHRTRELFAAVNGGHSRLRDTVDTIKGYHAHLDAATFKLNPGEALFSTAKAEWVVENSGKIVYYNGVLFLTDQRILFEQNEKVDAFMGLFGGRQVHELKWQLALPSVDRAGAEVKPQLLGKKELLELIMQSGSNPSKVLVEVKAGADCAAWKLHIEHLKRDGFQSERRKQP
jgi:hypothetical protein